MSELLFGLLFTSIISIVLFGMGMIFLDYKHSERYFQELYCFSHLYIGLLPALLLAIITVLICIKLSPGIVLIDIQTKHTEMVVEILCAGWLMGALVRLIGFIRKEYVQSRKRQRFLAEEDLQQRAIVLAKQMNIYCTPKVYICEGVHSAELRGYLRPIILYPDGLYSESIRDGMLIHELCHYKHGDGIVRKICGILRMIFWFNPIFHIMLEYIDRLDEKHCDYQVCKSECMDYLIYSEVVVEVAERKEQYRDRKPWLIRMHGEKDELNERVDLILNYKNIKKMNRVWAASVAICMLVLGSGITVAAAVGVNAVNDWDLENNQFGQEEELPPQEELVEYEASAEEMLAEDDFIVSVAPNAKSDGYISVTLQDQTWKSGVFTATSGQSINVMVSVEPADVLIHIGIIEPDGSWRWVRSTGMFSKTFELDQTGLYQVFVRNTTKDSAEIVGAYKTNSAQ